MNDNQMFHYFLINGMQFLVFDFNAVDGSVMCADLLGFLEDEVEALIDIAMSDKAQSTPYLGRILAQEDGGSFSWLKLNQFRTTLDEITGYIPSAQVEAFRADYAAAHKTEETIDDILYGRIK